MVAAALGVVVIGVLLASRVPPPERGGRAVGEPSSLPATDDEPPRPTVPVVPGEPAREAGTSANPLHAPDPEAAWLGHAARAVREVAKERFGRTLTPAEERRLVDAMAGVRWAAGEGERETVDPQDPVSLARERERNETILAADAAYRDLLGVGVGEFLHMLSPEQVEDLAPSPTPQP